MNEASHGKQKFQPKEKDTDVQDKFIIISERDNEAEFFTVNTQQQQHTFVLCLATILYSTIFKQL